MRRALACGLWIVSCTAWASHLGDGPVELLVLVDTGPTVSSAPFLQKIHTAVANKERALQDAKSRLRSANLDPRGLSEKDLFPLSSTRMRSGTPLYLIRPGITQPIFVIGMDAHSLRWLEQEFDHLKHIGALGVVVDAPDVSAFHRLRASALKRGVLIDIGFGDAMATAFRFDTYPTVIAGSPR